jgi:hypothetical protein
VTGEAVVTIIAVMRPWIARGGGRFPATAVIGTFHAIVTILVILAIGLLGRYQRAAGRIGESDPFRSAPGARSGKVDRCE